MAVGGAHGFYLVDARDNKVLRRFVGHTWSIMAVAPTPDGKFILTGSNDQTLRVWRADKDEPVLSLFFAGRDWIAWTPEGYYAASANGERLVGWQINDGPDRVATYVPAIQFRPSLYQPDVIKALFNGADGDLGRAVAQASRERKQQIAAVNLTQVLPPAVAITAPRAGAGVPAGKVKIAAEARPNGPNPVTAMRLLVNGRPYNGGAGVHRFLGGGAGKVEAAWEVEVGPGRTSFVVQAESAVSKGMSAAVEVTRGGPPAVRPNLYVFAVGVSEYPGKLRLQFGASDARNLTNVLRTKTKGTFASAEIRLATDAQATKSAVLDGLEWLKGKATPGDVSVFYFSGHGALDDDDKFYLVPVDARVSDVGRSCVPGDAVRDALTNTPGKVVAILDACHSGSVAEKLKAGRPDGMVRDMVSDECGLVVMCSSLGAEYSLEGPDVQGGFFTTGLVEALSGKADYNRDGVVMISEADVYAAWRVRQLSGGEQNPVTGRPPTIRPFPLTRP